MKETLKIGVSGVRGVVGESFTPQLAATFAQAFGTHVGPGVVLIGRDTRPSGVMIEHAIVAGLQSVGCKPILVGVLPTPSLLFLVRYRSARGGIMITASHNAASWNALKFVDRRGLFLGPVHTEELIDIYHQRDFTLSTESDLRSIDSIDEPVAPHHNRVIDYVDAVSIQKAEFSVAVDCCNGVGAIHTPGFLRDRLGCRVATLFDEPSGYFQREPEPLPENLGALCRMVQQKGCAIGFAQDPDGDRLAVVDERGKPIGEALTVALAVRAVLQLHEKGPVAANLSSGKSIEGVAQEAGCSLIRTRTGEVHVSEAMLKNGAVVGGEHTGGIIIPAIHPCRDSYGGMAVILEYMAQSGLSVSALCDAIPQYHLVKEKLPLTAENASGILRAVRHHYEGCNRLFLDGVFVDFGDRWVHVRRSNTEPVLRLIAEAPTEKESQALLNEIRAIYASVTSAAHAS